MENENKNVIYTVGGLIGAALIAWGSIATVKFVNTRNDKEKAQQEFLQKDQARVDDYNLLDGKYTDVVKDGKAKDSIITVRDNNIKGLKNELYQLNIQYDTKSAQYADALGTIDSITAIINADRQEKKNLEVILVNNKIKIKGLETELTDIRKNLLDAKALSRAQSDTIGIMQNYLNIYMVNRLPIKPKHAERVYLPGNLRLLPTDVMEIKEIKALNKEYKENK